MPDAWSFGVRLMPGGPDDPVRLSPERKRQVRAILRDHVAEGAACRACGQPWVCEFRAAALRWVALAGLTPERLGLPGGA